jgi:epoxyqueuosine reductase QueG
MTVSFKENKEQAIINEIINYVVGNSDNCKKKMDETPYFESPLVGFANAGDPIFETFKDEEIVGEHHLTPQEMFAQSLPDQDGNCKAASVISWVLPIYKETRVSNRKQNRFPSKAWSQTRTYGQEFNDQLSTHITEFLQNNGCCAVAPIHSAAFKEFHVDTEVYITSNWSERHIAYAAGMGTFGLHGSLITQKGSAMRCGSVVTDLKLRPTTRPYKGAHDYCLHFNSGTCGVCIKRCPSGAVTKKRQNNETCMTHFAEVVMNTLDYDASLPGCGLCQTAVPCEAAIPKQKT